MKKQAHHHINVWIQSQQLQIDKYPAPNIRFKLSPPSLSLSLFSLSCVIAQANLLPFLFKPFKRHSFTRYLYTRKQGSTEAAKASIGLAIKDGDGRLVREAEQEILEAGLRCIMAVEAPRPVANVLPRRPAISRSLLPRSTSPRWRSLFLLPLLWLPPLIFFHSFLLLFGCLRCSSSTN